MQYKNVIGFLVIVIVGIIVFYQYKKYRVAPVIDFFNQKVLDENNQEVDLSKYKGKKLIVSYYASWCGDCLRELKGLAAIKSADLADVEVLAITDESMEELTSFKNKKNYPFTFYKLPQTFDKINIYAIPVTYIINRKGELVYEKVGAIDWENASFTAHVKTLL